MDMRTGKTLLTIRRVKRWGCKGMKIIFCPESAIQGWLDELKSEGYNNITEIKGSAKQRLQAMTVGIMSNCEWYVTNKEIHRSTPEIAGYGWDVVIFDESRFLANPKSKMSKFYVNNFRCVDHRIILTGTPDYKQKMDFYQQLRFLDYRILPYKDFWHFRMQAFFQSGYDWIIKKHHDNVLKNALNKNCIFIRREDIKGGRTQEYIKYVIKMPRKLRREYDTIEKEFVYDKQDMKTIFATEAHIWMMRICGGMRRTRNDSFLLEWDGKLKVLKELLSTDLKNESVVVFCRFKAEVYRLNNILTATYTEKENLKSCSFTGDFKKDMRRKIIKEFNEKHIKILIAHPAAISHGTDLSAATCIIFYSQPNGGEIRDQSEKRIMTYADEKHMLIIDLLVKDTVDEDTRIGHLEGNSRREMFERAVKRHGKKLK